MSLPSWERGLKYLHTSYQNYLPYVAPLVGAWIEILNLSISMYVFPVSLPSWERGLKSTISSTSPSTRASLPSWERGLKSEINTVFYFIAMRRSPRGSVD